MLFLAFPMAFLLSNFFTTSSPERKMKNKLIPPFFVSLCFRIDTLFFYRIYPGCNNNTKNMNYRKNTKKFSKDFSAHPAVLFLFEGVVKRGKDKNEISFEDPEKLSFNSNT